MAETDLTRPEIPNPRQGLGQLAINGIGRQTSPDPERARQFPLLTAAETYWEQDVDYSNASATEQAALRPALTHKFIREETLRRYPGTKKLLPAPMVERHLKTFLQEHGAQVPKDRVKQKRREAFQHETMTHAAAFAGIDELRVAYDLDAEIVQAEDPELLDTIQVLIAAYGSTIKTIAKSPYQGRKE